jgi:hypothetical protein
VTSIRADGFTVTPPDAGILHLTNGAAETESVAYSSYSVNGTGDYTFAVSTTLTYIYLNNDQCQFENTAPCIRTLNVDIDASDAANGNIVIESLDANTSTFFSAVNGLASGQRTGYFELRGYDVGGNIVYYVRFDVTLQALVDPNTGVPPGPEANYYTKAEADAKFATTGTAGGYYTRTFTNADLVAGKLTVAHALGRQLVNVEVMDASYLKIDPDDITYTSVNSLGIDLAGFGTITGTWTVIVGYGGTGTGGGGTGLTRAEIMTLIA